MKKSIFQSVKSAFNLSYLTLIVLFCFAVATSFMTINYQAKYLSTDSGNDGARVAKFDVKLITTAEDETYLNGLTNEEKTQDTKTYNFSVTNNSEVAVGYDIKVTFSNSLPSGVTPTLRIADKENVNGTYDSERKTFTFKSSDFVFNSNSNTNIHTLTILVNYYDEKNNLTDVDFSSAEVSIAVVARQLG